MCGVGLGLLVVKFSRDEEWNGLLDHEFRTFFEIPRDCMAGSQVPPG